MLLGRRFQRKANGVIRLRLTRSERELLRTVRAELADLLDENPDDPDLRRLFPPAHVEPEREAEYRTLVHDELVQRRRRALDALLETVDSDMLTVDEADEWLTILNDARLVLGTRLDITEETNLAAIDLRDPRARERAVYIYLSWLQEQLVEAIAAGIDPGRR